MHPARAKENSVKIAHVGLGYWGPKILRNLVEQAGIAQVVAIDSDVRRLTNACLQYPDLQIASSLDERKPDACRH